MPFFLIILLLITPLTASLDSTINLTSQDRENQQTKDQLDLVLPGEDIYLENTINPDQYIVGPGDGLSFSMMAADRIFTLFLEVSPLGDVLIPAIGVISIDGMTLTTAMKLIEERCLEKHRNAVVHLTLSRLRRFKVLVTGPVAFPGYVVATSVMRVDEIIELAEGDSSTQDISRRNISLFRNGDTLRVDLVKFHMSGNKFWNPTVQQGDMIHVRYKNENVGIWGGVAQPGSYEFVNGEALSDLILLSGGFTRNADSSNIEITRFVNDTDKVVINVDDFDQGRNMLLWAEDHIIIRLKRDYKRQDLVSIDGEIKYPGRYTIEPGITTIGDIIAKAGGFSQRADNTRISVNNEEISQLIDIELARIKLIPYEDRSTEEKAYLKARTRTPKGRLNSASQSFTLDIMNFPLQRNDVVRIPILHEYVEILGAVLHPGRYPLNPQFRNTDYIELAGGITKTATGRKYLIKSSTGQRVPLSDDLTIENGNVIFVEEKLEYNRWERFKEVMAIGGQMAAILAVIQTATRK